MHETFLRMNRCGAVFIAALNGSALGIGSELALACDYRLMADGDHVIGQPEILLGFPPGGGGTQRLVRLVGTHQGLKRMLDGGGLDPEAAAEIGYVDEVVPADELIDRAVALADRLAQRLKFTVAAVKRAAYIGGSLGLEEGLHVENAEFLSTLASPGAQAAMLAYMRAHRGDGRPAALRPTDLRADARSRQLRTHHGEPEHDTRPRPSRPARSPRPRPRPRGPRRPARSTSAERRSPTASSARAPACRSSSCTTSPPSWTTGTRGSSTASPPSDT